MPVAAAGASQIIGGIASIHRSMSSAVASHYNVQPVIDIYPSTHDRDLGSVATDIQKIIDSTAHERGSTITLQGKRL